MYQPPHFREDRLDILHDLIEAHPLGALIIMTAAGFEANHVPFLINRSAGLFGRLEAHVAVANPLTKIDVEVPAIVIFQGAESYITPSWYETKRETGKVVPTWNYAVVHAHGTMRLVRDDVWLARQIEALTNRHEAPRDKPWAVHDAPADYLRGQMKGIVGLTVDITRLEGKWKVSQNRPVADRHGVVTGLGENAMAGLVAERAGP